MSEKSTTSTAPDGPAVRDRDDPPRFTREMAERGRHMLGDRTLREARPRGRPPKAKGESKEKVTLRLSPDVLEDARGSGAGWQTRMDEQMRHILEFQRAIATGREPLPRTEVERQLREIMRKASELIQASQATRKDDAASAVLGRVAADHERIARLIAGIAGTAPLVPIPDARKRRELNRSPQ